MKCITVVLIVSALKIYGCSAFGHTENVAFGKISHISSFHASFTSNHAWLAVNNNTGGELVDGVNCVHSAPKDYEPWWTVDLGRRYYVRNITVWVRTGFVRRMSLIKILVDGRQCFDFGREERDPNNRELQVSCSTSLVGRFVKVQKNCTANDVLCKDQDNTIMLCEIMVFSCSAQFWGPDCDKPCGHCNGGEDCDKVDGNCTACKPGWVPPLCNQGCPGGTYGTNCMNNCPSGCQKPCNQATGQCTACNPGWTGSWCEQECPNGTYGIHCKQNCTTGCQGPCHKASGICAECKPGLTGQLCDQEKRETVAQCQLSDLAAIGGGLAGAVVLNAVIVVFVIDHYFRRWQLNHAMEMTGVPRKSTANMIEE